MIDNLRCQHFCRESNSKLINFAGMGKEKSKKRRQSSSSDESNTDSSSSDSSHERKKLRKLQKKLKKEQKKTKKLLKKKLKEEKRKSKKIRRSNSNEGEEKEATADIPIELMEESKAMAPMTREEWEQRQSVVKRVIDEETGRYRLIKGDGEVLEEIVSRDRHKQINRQATHADGAFFQARTLDKKRLL